MTCAVVVAATILVPAALQSLFGKLDSEQQSFGLQHGPDNMQRWTIS